MVRLPLPAKDWIWIVHIRKGIVPGSSKMTQENVKLAFFLDYCSGFVLSGSPHFSSHTFQVLPRLFGLGRSQKPTTYVVLVNGIFNLNSCTPS